VTAVASGATTTQRDQHIATIEKHGRMGWQRRSGYNRRSLIETAMFRYKTIIDRRPHARNLPDQRTEAKIGCNVLNQMTALGMPVSVRVYWYASQEGDITGGRSVHQRDGYRLRRRK
jgi:hypothetical protein